jgi:hypothetical protein
MTTRAGTTNAGTNSKPAIPANAIAGNPISTREIDPKDCQENSFQRFIEKFIHKTHSKNRFEGFIQSLA